MKYRHGLAFPDDDEYLFDRLPMTGVWQHDALKAALRHCKQFRTAIDGGAHVGTWSLALADQFETVIAFEPAELTYVALCENVAKRRNIYPRRAALGREPGLARMMHTDKDRKRKHTGARFAIPANVGVEMVTIDSLDLTDLDFLKLDLEGGESDAILGARETLTRCRPVVVVESRKFEKRYGYPKAYAETLLDALGAVELAVCGINRVWGWR